MTAAEDRLREDVEALCRIVRSSAGEGERRAAAWVAGQLRDAGLRPVVQPYRSPRGYALAHALHDAAGLAAIGRGGLLGAALTLAVLRSYERETSGRDQWVRRVLPSGEGANVVVRIPGTGEVRRTLVLVAHLDAAPTGWVWRPAFANAGAGLARRTRRMSPVMGALTGAFLAGAAGSAVERAAPRAGRALRTGALATIGVGLAGLVSVARGATVPGASDNATGVAVLLGLARALAAAPPVGVDVVLVLPGGEEAGMGGMRAFADGPVLAAALAAGPVTVVGVDTLGGGTPIVAAAEGAMRTHRFDPEAVALVQAGARAAGEDPPARWRIGAWTDPVLTQHRGIPSTTLLSVGDRGHYTEYHLPTDTPDRVDWDCVERCARIVAGVVVAASG
ncbi:M20/M25/M40 family metallo-hydrolase [Paraconexibacter algicola]|uniref:Peptidase M28 domain-containing protein n=1 Tax=Paraconexibacter algicola TaxID=2133960 RepID=A0A2T4UKG8_9ACTN|nr:M20/M25/M40 family metallo-hydrolase [Paraconexibacter algicola]PTL59705.1 hypothetical protein C7Y72_08595 [Paraconexibacter algicola]